MELKNFSYLLILIATVAVPLFLSFGKRHYSPVNFKFMLPAILFSEAIFIIWDLHFEERSIWQFNPEFVMGKNILNLPAEEWLYFIAVSFLGTFIYESLDRWLAGFEYPNIFLSVSLLLLLLFGVLAYVSRQKLYPFFTFFLLTIYLGYTIFRNHFKKYYTRFYVSYLVLLVPFIIISGILTALPIIEYNPDFILGIKLYSIPVENFAALFLLQLMNITIYEYLKERQIY